jgi:hypothetical protein
MISSVYVAEDVCRDLFERGDLPDRVVLRRDRVGAWPTARTGDVFAWSEQERGYVRERTLPPCVYLAGVVRAGWGFLFSAAPAEQLELSA